MPRQSSSRDKSTHWRTDAVQKFLISALALGLGPQAALPQPTAHHPGKWTNLSQDWGRAAVHMVLLPGDTTTAISDILWWFGQATSSPLQGGLWRWSPPVDATVNAGTFPNSSFTCQRSCKTPQLGSLKVPHPQPEEAWSGGRHS